MANYLWRRLQELDDVDHDVSIGKLAQKVLVARLNFCRLEPLINRIYPQFTLHDRRHSRAVEELAGQICSKSGLLTSGSFFTLNAQEIYFLIASAWLHDVGLTQLDEKKDPIEATKREYRTVWQLVREEHHLRSEKYVLDHREELYIDDDEARILGLICRGHRKSEDLEKSPYKNEVGPRGSTIHAPLLSAILRVADALDLDHSRAPKNIREIWDKSGWLDQSSKVHWLIHYYTKGTQLSYNVRDRHLVKPYIEIRVPDEFHRERVYDQIKAHLDKEIDSVRNATADAGFAFDTPEIREEYDKNLEKHFLRFQDVCLLMVDDDEPYLNLQYSKLSKKFGQIKKAENALEAFNYVMENRGKVHAVVVDLDLPDMEGMQSPTGGIPLIKVLRELYPQMAIVANSNNMTEDLVKKCFQAGSSNTHNKRDGNEEKVIYDSIKQFFFLVS